MARDAGERSAVVERAGAGEGQLRRLGRFLGGRGALLAGGAVLFAALGWFANGWWTGRGGEPAPRRVRLGGFRLVSPLLDVELPEGYSVRHEPIPFKHQVARFVEDQIASGKVREMSVYYRDLLDGPWFGINEKRKYDPASLLKVPVMIAWLKRAEHDPRVLQGTFLFDAQSYPGGPQNVAPARSLVPGTRYTVEELLRYMVAYSDNKAMWLLYSALGQEELGRVMDGMDVANDPSVAGNAMSAHGYSGFFRILFNAAYLGKEMSEKALQLLTEQEFRQGIAGGVPQGTTVAAKFGERTPLSGVEGVQFHEFGIVYHPRGPYILGVMTAGNDLRVQAEVVRQLSALVYQEVDGPALGGQGW